MSVPVDTRITPALDPETYRNVEGYAEHTRGYVDDVVNAFNDAYVTLGKIFDAAELWRRNAATPEAQAILIVGKEAAKQKDRVSRRLDAACAALAGRIAHVEGELHTPLVQQAALGALNGEIRSHFKSLNRSEREKLLNEALATDDDGTLQAVLGGQAFLSGLSIIDHQHFTRLYHEKRNPHLVERLDVMKRMDEMAGRNSGLLHKAFERAVGAKPHEVNAINNADVAARNALKIEPAA